MKYIDYYLNKISMYRLVSLGLLFVALIAVLFGFTGTLTLSGGSLLMTLLVVMVAGIAADQIFSRIFNFASNEGSSMITTLIIFFLFFPANNVSSAALLVLVTFVAIGSKYLIAYKKRHIFNPAAIAAVILGIAGVVHAAWWVGNAVLAPFIIILALLILRKLHRFTLFISFFVTAVVIAVIRDADVVQNTSQLLNDVVISSPLLFLGAIMLTEPSTLPTGNKLHVAYGVLVGALYALPLPHVTPELALVLGNVIAFGASAPLRYRAKLNLMHTRPLSDNITEYSFKPDQPLRYAAGQYVDMTLPVMAMDFRGNRRTFTVASSPTEDKLLFATKNSTSKFKSILNSSPENARVFIDGASGSFTLPKDYSQPLVWIAGGIGVTPFRSMAKYIIDTKQQRDVAMYYLASKNDFVYQDIFSAAQAHGVATTYIEHRSLFNADYIQKSVPNYKNRMYFISGPDAMVRHYRKVLVSLNISQKNIITDYFSGY